MSKEIQRVTQEQLLKLPSNFIGERLRQAREGRGYQINELAASLGLTRETIRRYESNEYPPPSEVLDKIGEQLRFPIGFFTKPLIDPFEDRPVLYRSLKSVGKLERTRAENHLVWLYELVNYVDKYVELPDLNLPKTLIESMPNDPKKITTDLIENTATKLRGLWGLGEAPIENILNLLESNGFIISLINLDTAGLDGLSRWSIDGKPFIFANSDDTTAVRLRFSICHELGHIILHANLPKEIVTKDKMSKTLDEQAHRFASAFLMPEEAFLADVYAINLDALKYIKPTWEVAIAAMIERLKGLNMLTDNSYTTLRRKYSKWRYKEPYDDEWENENPILLKKAMNVIVENFHSAERIAYETNLDKRLIIDLLNLDLDYFGREDLGDKIITVTIKDMLKDVSQTTKS